MTGFEIILLVFLLVCAVAAALTRRLLVSVIIYMGYSLVMSLIWVLLQSPDLAITEAAVGAGVTSLLFFVTLRKIDRIHEEQERDGQEGGGSDEKADS